MGHKEILLALGDNQAIGSRLGVHHSTVSRWKTHGIPPENWLAIARMARERKLEWISLELIEVCSPVYGERARSRQTQPVS